MTKYNFFRMQNRCLPPRGPLCFCSVAQDSADRVPAAGFDHRHGLFSSVFYWRKLVNFTTKILSGSIFYRQNTYHIDSGRLFCDGCVIEQSNDEWSALAEASQVCRLWYQREPKNLLLKIASVRGADWLWSATACFLWMGLLRDLLSAVLCQRQSYCRLDHCFCLICQAAGALRCFPWASVIL